jgi:hypothetical protein
MKSVPEPERRLLQRLVGEWTYESEGFGCSAGSPGAPFKATGSERVRALGDGWVVAEGQGELPGAGPTSTMMTLGYDPRSKRYVGSWVASMMPYVWVYEGAIDASGQVLTLDCEGPSMSGDGALCRYQDVIELKSDDYRVLRARVMRDDGAWHEFMTTHYRRWV